ncbi:efflux RND transporter periplasmic adaptor subunit [Mycoplana sp. BE70]|uniref:efflux RND transporter periplasmic adaptor subunit n=1 Tax=Mycoplana sp. BE70 TaxID=2817775 RepID=UPI0038620A23
METRGQQCRCLQFSVVLAAAATLSSCDSKNEYIPPPPPAVRVAQPLVQPVTSYFELNGNTAAFNSVDIQARVQGFLLTIDYRDGAFVKQDAQLFSIQRNTYTAQRDQAQASLTSANAAMVERTQERDRQNELMTHQVTTQANVDIANAHYDEAKANILNAQAALQLTEINLGYTRVVAPFDGVVSAHLVDAGALVGVDGPTKLATIVQIDPIYVYFNVTEPQVLEIKRDLVRQGKTFREIDLPNVPFEIGLQGEDGYPHKGKLDYTAPQVDAATGTLQVRGVLDNKDHALLPGLFVRVRVPIGHRDGGIFVRDVSIGTNQQGNYVLVLGKDDVVEQRQVQIGQRQGQLRVIEKGLDPSDWVVAEGIQRAVPGAKVAPEKVKFDAGESASSAPLAAVASSAATPAQAPAEGAKP